MRDARQVVATSTRTQTSEPARPTGLPLDVPRDDPPPPAPLPRLGPAAHIREALLRWLEEDM